MSEPEFLRPDDLPDFPMTALELVEYLDRKHPARCIYRGEDLIDHHRYAAVRDMIDQLIAWRDLPPLPKETDASSH